MRMLEKVNLVCPRCGNGNYMRSLRGIDTVYQFKCINCNSYFKNEDIAEKRENENKCYWCENLENGDKLTFVRDWDGGTYNETIYDIQFCPVCGKALKDGEQE